MLFYLYISFVYSNKPKQFIKINTKAEWYDNGIKHISSARLIQERIYKSTNISLYNCEFKSIHSSSNGGAIYLNLTTICKAINIFDSCQFINCSGTSMGGAIYIISNQCNNTANFKKCRFINNSCLEQGGSIYSSKTDIVLIQSSFINNYINSNFHCMGGAICLITSNGNISECDFINNFISHDNKYFHHYRSEGGAIYANSLLILNSSIFNGNHIYINSTDYDLYDQRGCAVYSSTSAIYNCSFKDNFYHVIIIENRYGHLHSNGAIIYCGSSSSNISRCMFADNYFIINTSVSIKMDHIDIYGGLFRLHSKNISDCDFINNSLHCYGDNIDCDGGILYSGQYIYNCSMINNSINFFGDVRYLDEAILAGSSSAQNCTFHSNTVFIQSNSSFIASIRGLFHIYPNIADCSFINNSIDSYSCTRITGGCLWAGSSQMKGCTFQNNYVNTHKNSSNIEGIAAYFSSKVNISNCSFINNVAYSTYKNQVSNSGAINALYGLFLEECIFINNYCDHGCDVYYTSPSNGNFNISNCIFEKRCRNDFQMNAFIYLIYKVNTSFVQIFQNNQIILHDAHQIHVFGGKINNPNQIKWRIQHNCIAPYKEEFYKNSSIKFYEELGKKEITFYQAFNERCPIPTSCFTFSYYFTESNKFSETNEFSKSYEFSHSSEFSKSYEFTYSNDFSYSNEFTQSQKFSKSEKFTQSNKFNLSDKFTHSKEFSISNKFSSSNEFSSSNKFSYSDVFSISNKFTKSSIFPDSKKFTHSDEFSLSKEFSQTNQFSRTKEFTQTNKFSQTNNFTESDNFNKSDQFTYSNLFSASKEFTRTKEFSKTYIFTQTNAFSESKLFSKSDTFTESKEFHELEQFTDSNQFSASKKFTQSDEFNTMNEFNRSNHYFQSNEFSTINEFNRSNHYFQSNEFDNPDKNTQIYRSNEFSTMNEFTEQANTIDINSNNNINDNNNNNEKRSIDISKHQTQINNDHPSSVTKGGGTKTITIVGIIIGCIAAIAILTAIIIFIIYKKKKQSDDEEVEQNIKEQIPPETKSIEENSSNVLDNEERDLDFWL